MSSISNILNHFPEFQQLPSHTPIALKTQQFHARAETSSTSQLSFLTAEGDRVSISAGSESRFSFDSYTAQGLTEGQAVDIRNQQSNTSLRTDFSLLVEGDLNEQELADIQRFIQTAQDLFNNFRSGNVDETEEAALSLDDLESLSTAALFFRQETTVAVQARSTELASKGNEASQPFRGKGIVAERGPTIENFLERIRKAQEQFQINPDTLATQLPALLTTLVETLEKPLSKEESPQSLFEQIRKELFPSLLQAIQNLASEPETTDELAEEANELEADNSALQPTVESGEILANLLNESEES